MKKIDFKQPKFMLAFITMPFVILIAYLISTQFKESEAKAEAEAKAQTTLEVTEDFNMNLPEPDLKNREVKDKFGAFQDEFKKSKDYSAMAGIKEDKDVGEDLSTLYTDDEIDDIQSTHAKNAEDARKVKDMQRKFFDRGSKSEPKSQESEDMQRLRQQMALIDSLKNIGKEEPNEKIKASNVEINEEPIIEAVKAENSNSKYFNTIKKDDRESFITAIIDEVQTVKSASRIRIRLLDDIMLGDRHLKKGTYLYGIVGGFGGQRIVVNINSILYENTIINTNLTLYDNDGIKGIYVPASDFREIMQAATAQLGQQQMSFSDGTNNLQEFAYGALQDIYRTTTQALTKKIKQNKAKVKYNTVVYLINEKDNKKRR